MINRAEAFRGNLPLNASFSALWHDAPVAGGKTQFSGAPPPYPGPTFGRPKVGGKTAGETPGPLFLSNRSRSNLDSAVPLNEKVLRGSDLSRVSSPTSAGLCPEGYALSSLQSVTGGNATGWDPVTPEAGRLRRLALRGLPSPAPWGYFAIGGKVTKTPPGTPRTPFFPIGRSKVLIPGCH